MMLGPDQRSDSLNINMFSVHHLYVDVINQLEKILLGQDRDQHIMTDLTQYQCSTFIHAIKHYMNHQPDFFQECTRKREISGNDDQYAQKRKQMRIMKVQEENKRKFLEEKKKQITKIKSEENLQLVKHQQEPKNFSMINENPFFHSTENEKRSILSGENITGISSKIKIEDNIFSRELETNELQKSEEYSNDLDDYERINADKNANKNMMNPYLVAKVQSESYHSPKIQAKIKYSEQQQNMNDDSSSEYHWPRIRNIPKYQIQRRRINYNEEVIDKTNCIIFGSYKSGALRYKSKTNEVSLTLNNCFLKMASNGRDAFLERLQVRLVKIEDAQVNL